MEQSRVNLGQLAATSKLFARRLLTIGENRLELLMVEVQEERECLLRTILFAFGVTCLAVLDGVAPTVAIVALLWKISPIPVFLMVAGLYAASAVRLQRSSPCSCATERLSGNHGHTDIIVSAGRNTFLMG